MTQFNIKGADKINAFLKALPDKVQNNIARGMLREAAKPVAQESRNLVPMGEPSDTAKRRYKIYAGALRDSIRITSRIDRRNGVVTASVKAGGKIRRTGADVFYSHFLEFGTNPHGGGSQNPGISPRPFMRPAIDSQAQAAIAAAAEYVKKRLATKHGLDTADISIEVEEEA